jgi:hypothetical protein
MSLEFSHGDAHWSTFGFGRFRERLAAEISMDLDAMDGYGGPILWPPEPYEDPLLYLLNHSDSEGEVDPMVCGALAARLRSLVTTWPDDDNKEQALKLASGLALAAQEGQPLRFL